MIFLIFILWFLLAEAIIVVTRLALRHLKIRFWVSLVIIFLELVGGTAIAYATMATDIGYWPVSPFLMAFYVALFGDAAAQIIYLLITIFVKPTRRFLTLQSISSLLAVAFLAFGMVNMQVVNAKHISYSSSKLASSYKVAFVSDVHVGSSQLMSTTLKTFEKIKAESPDYLIIGGDLVDEYTTKEEMVEVSAALKDYVCPVYFVHGNHDLLGSFTIADLEAELVKNGVTVVTDEFVSLSSDLMLLGRDDLSSKTRKEIGALNNPDPSKFLLVADHQPFAFEDNCKIGFDLQLSGHTHAGQLFPLNFVNGLAVQSYGEYRNGNAILNVSSGASGWQNPVRTEIGCQFEIVTLSPAS